MNLEEQLSAFDVAPTQGVISNPNIPTSNKQEIVEDAETVEDTGAVESDSDDSEVSESDLQAELEGTESTEETEDEVEEEDEEEETSPEFQSQFKEAFGMEVNEARELVTDLQNFKSEMVLMRDWGVTPSEYDSRITQVREFYQGLPEDGRDKFNSPEGARAIWNHISKTSESSNKKSPKRTKGTLGKSSQSRKKQPELIKRSDILKMNDADYQANYGRISKAFAENRIIEDK